MEQSGNPALMGSALTEHALGQTLGAIVTPAIKHLRKEIARLSAAEMPA